MNADYQKVIDASLIIDEFEKKIVKTPVSAVALLAYRPLQQGEMLLSRGVETSSLKLKAMEEDYKKNSPMGEANQWVKDFYKKGKQADREFSPPPGALGSNKVFKNTVAAFFSEKNTTEEKIAAFFADCLPCETRIESLLLMNPIPPVLKGLQDFAKTVTDLCKKLTDVITSASPISGNICDLLNVMNFTCLPDIKAMIAMLKKYLVLLTKPGPIKLPSFTAIIGALISPILGVVVNLASTWSQAILGPVDCILTQLNTQLKKVSPNQKNIVQTLITTIEKARQAASSFVQNLINKFSSLINMLKKSITKTMAIAMEVPLITRIIQILLTMEKIFTQDIFSCGFMSTPMSTVAVEAADKLASSDPGKIKVRSSEKISTFIPVENLTEKERTVLGLPPPLSDSQREGLVDYLKLNNPEIMSRIAPLPKDAYQKKVASFIKKDSLTPIISGGEIALSGCKNKNREFLKVETLIQAF